MANIEQIAGRPAKYLAQTGLPQLTSGLGFSIIGSASLIQNFLAATPVYRDYSLVAAWAGTCLAFVVLCLLFVVKRRIVFPRGGYVKPLGTRTRLIFWPVLVGVAVLLWAVARRRGTQFLGDSALVWPGFAILFAVICLDGGRRQKSVPMLCFGIYLLCLAPLLWWLPVNEFARGGAFEVAAGAPLAVIGAVCLRRFLRTNPPPETVDE
jgi:hypothetical protein